MGFWVQAGISNEAQSAPERRSRERLIRWPSVYSSSSSRVSTKNSPIDPCACSRIHESFHTDCSLGRCRLLSSSGMPVSVPVAEFFFFGLLSGLPIGGLVCPLAATRQAKKLAVLHIGRQWRISVVMLCRTVMQSLTADRSTREATLTGFEPVLPP